MSIIIENAKTGTKAQDFSAIEFAIAASSKVTTNYTLVCICIRNGYVYGADGMRAHRAELAGDYPEGTYNVISQNKKTIVLDNDSDINYPNIDKIMLLNDSTTKFHSTDWQSYYKRRETITECAGYITQCLCMMAQKLGYDMRVNIDYVASILKHVDSIKEFQFVLYQDRKSKNVEKIIFKNSDESQMAIIMPVKIG